jgi:hypothetical protein
MEAIKQLFLNLNSCNSLDEIFTTIKNEKARAQNDNSLSSYLYDLIEIEIFSKVSE